MINLTLKGIEKGSSVMEIEAAILRIMEKVNFLPKEINTELTDAKTEGFLTIVFAVQECTVKELTDLQSEFGGNFHMKVLGKSKSGIFLQIEAHKNEFLALGKRYVYQEPRREQQSRPDHTPTNNNHQQ